MRKEVTFYQIDGKPMLAPDTEPEFTFTDLDSSDSGRDESGVMHRIVVREKVGTWGFTYSRLTDAQYAYLVGLFAGKAQFSFTHPRVLHRDRSFNLLLQQLQRSLAQCPHRHLEKPEIQHH